MAVSEGIQAVASIVKSTSATHQILQRLQKRFGSTSVKEWKDRPIFQPLEKEEKDANTNSTRSILQ